MHRMLMPALGLLGLVVLCLLCVRCHAPRIEAELTDQGRELLAAEGFDPTVLRIDGRDATLEGVVGSEEHRLAAARLVADVPGMRVVDNRLSLPVPVRFELDRSGETAVLTGRLPNEAHRAAILSRAHDLWSAGTITDDLRVDAAVEEPEWLGGLPDALTAFDRRTRGGSFAVDGEELTLGGRLFAESARQALLERLGRILPGLPIADRSEVMPPATTEELQAALDTAVTIRTVEFASGSAELTTLGRSVLDEIFELLSSRETMPIAISGHTDDQGNDDYNLDLSRRRAEAAGDYLVGKGLAAGLLESAGFGETRPIADNTTPEGRLRNRRIEFDVLKQSSLEENK